MAGEVKTKLSKNLLRMKVRRGRRRRREGGAGKARSAVGRGGRPGGGRMEPPPAPARVERPVDGPRGAVSRGLSRTNHPGEPSPGVGHFPWLPLARQRLSCSDTPVSPASRNARFTVTYLFIFSFRWPSAQACSCVGCPLPTSPARSDPRVVTQYRAAETLARGLRGL